MLVKMYNNCTLKVEFSFPSFRIIKTEKFLKDCPDDENTYTLCRKIDQFGKHENKLGQIIFPTFESSSNIEANIDCLGCVIIFPPIIHIYALVPKCVKSHKIDPKVKYATRSNICISFVQMPKLLDFIQILYVIASYLWYLL